MSGYTSNLSYMHWHGVKRILKYLKKTQNYGIRYSGHLLVLEDIHMLVRSLKKRIIYLLLDGYSCSEEVLFLGDPRNKLA